MQETRLRVRGRVGRTMSSLQVHMEYRVSTDSMHGGEACPFTRLILPVIPGQPHPTQKPSFQACNSFSQCPVPRDSCNSDQSSHYYRVRCWTLSCCEQLQRLGGPLDTTPHPMMSFLTPSSYKALLPCSQTGKTNHSQCYCE